MSSDVEISVPDLGDFAEVTVIEVNVRVGDSITEEDIVLVLESDKATLDVPSPHAGTVSAVKVSEGDSVSAGTPILSLSGVSESETAAEPVDQQRAATPIALLDNALAKPQPEESLPEPGWELLDNEDNKIGEVTSVCSNENEIIGLGYVKTGKNPFKTNNTKKDLHNEVILRDTPFTD